MTFQEVMDAVHNDDYVNIRIKNNNNEIIDECAYDGNGYRSRKNNFYYTATIKIQDYMWLDDGDMTVWLKT